MASKANEAVTTSGTKGFTPGPWRIVIDDDGNPLSGRPSIMASDELDCGIVHWDGFVQEYWRSARGDKEIHANARLIAAAPELYEALKQCSAILAGYARKGIVSEQDTFRIQESGLSITVAAALDNADTALSKANGEQA